MKCENCQELLSEFIDDQLDEKTVARVKAHLTLCADCKEIYQDFSSILGVCDLDLTEDVSLPNEQALWCRINNIIETEAKSEIAELNHAKTEPQGWFSSIKRRSWSLSFAQLASAILGIALISSLLTIVGLRNAPSPNEVNSGASNQPTIFEKVLSKVGLMESAQQTRERHLHEQQTAIDYWNKRVEARRAQWNNHLRDAFDRNLSEIDQVVGEYTRTLEENPQDELTNEMLDSALDEKVELLREFSEL